MLRGLSRPRRVVITGMGCVTPLGVGRAAFWSALRRGESGIRRIEGFDVSRSPVQIAGQGGDFDWEAELKPKDRRHVARTVPLALASAREAMADAGLDPSGFTMEERRAFGIVLGTGGGGLEFTERQYEQYYKRGDSATASVYTIPSSTHGGLSSELSMAFGLRGLSHIVSTGCTSSTDAIAYAAQHIALGRQEVMITGGVDAPLAPGILAGFNLMTVLTNEWNDEPHRASRPFSHDRSGIVLGEGAWIYVLEERERALERGADVYAEITGYGATCDAYHRVRLEETGDEPARAMTLALRDARSGARIGARRRCLCGDHGLRRDVRRLPPRAVGRDGRRAGSRHDARPARREIGSAHWSAAQMSMRRSRATARRATLTTACGWKRRATSRLAP